MRYILQVGVVHGHSEMIARLQRGLDLVTLDDAGQGQQERESREYGEVCGGTINHLAP